MCPSFAALHEKLFTPTAQLLGSGWHCASDKKKIDWLLNGISVADFQINLRLFQLVQSFTVFHYHVASVICCVCFLYLFLFFLFILSFFLYVCLILTYICIFKIFNVNSISSQDEPFRLNI